MRLATCIAVELIAGVAALGALGLGSAWGVGALRGSLGGVPAAVAASDAPVRAPDDAPDAPDAPGEADDRDDGATAPGAAAPGGTVGFDVAPAPADGGAGPAPTPGVTPGAAAAPVTAGASPADVAPDADPATLPAWRRGGLSDAAALAPLREGKLVKVKFNRGGSSLSLRLEFDNGARAAFKPEQVHPQSNPRKEIAAYRLDRLLGLHRVPPAVGRSFPVEELRAAVPPTDRGRLARLASEAIPRDGVYRGELSWWIPEVDDARIGGFTIDSTEGIVTWRRYLRAGARIPPAVLELCRQISDLAVFDFLLDNADRWTGSNAKTDPQGRVLYFMDNTMSLTVSRQGHHKGHLYLRRVQTFSRRLIAAVRGLTAESIRAAMAQDVAPFDWLLGQRELAALLSRRAVLLEYVDGLVAEHGEEKVLAFP